MIHVQLLSKDHCPLCDEAMAVLKDLQAEYSFHINVIDIYEDDELLEKYQLMIPVVMIDDKEIAYGRITKNDMKDYFATI